MGPDEELLTSWALREGKDLVSSLEGRILFTVEEGRPSRLDAAANAKVDKIWGSVDESQIDAVLVDGFDQFRRQVRDRILEQLPSADYRTRCPACDSLLATPVAQQCLRCGHDWHKEKGTD